MKLLHLASAFACASAFLSPISAANFAAEVIEYSSGTGFATEFGTGLGYTNSVSVLGEPSRTTEDPHPLFGGTFPVNPFSPPYLRSQLLSIGEGGSLIVKLDAPLFDNAANPFGIDFLIFGNAGFSITNGNFTGGGITDGSLFNPNVGSTTRISISADNNQYFTIDASLAPSLDNYFPMDGAGSFSVPVDPSLQPTAFSGRDLAGIRELYAGSGGGAGFDIAWARDSQGNPISLSSIEFIRIDVLNGALEIDAISAVPEPSPALLAALCGLVLAASRWARSWSR